MDVPQAGRSAQQQPAEPVARAEDAPRRARVGACPLEYLEEAKVSEALDVGHDYRRAFLVYTTAPLVVVVFIAFMFVSAAFRSSFALDQTRHVLAGHSL